MKTVVLAEKPDQGRKLAKALGKQKSKTKGAIDVASSILEGDVSVTWGIGHLVILSEPDDYADKYKQWELEDLPILPDQMKYKVSKGKAGQFKTVKNLLKQADRIIIATDPDREGENIAYSIFKLCGREVWQIPKKRLWINSLQSKEIQRGFKELREAEETYSYFKEAETRQVSDWIIGMNFTRFLTLIMQKRGVDGVGSVGRVQTPTNTLICENFLERKNFTPEPYWQLKGYHILDDGQVKFSEPRKDNKFFDKNKLEQYIQQYKLNNVEEATVDSVEKTKKSKSAPKLFSLGGLQSYCSSQFGWTASKTLKVLQKLYDSGYSSYPRTSSQLITTNEFNYLFDNIDSYKDWLAIDFEVAYSNPRKRFVDNKKVKEHYAIIPTDEIPSRLSGDQKKLYEAIVKRMLLMFAADYEYELTVVLVKANDVVFKTTGTTPIQLGWRDIESDDKDDNNDNSTLPEYQQRERIPFKVRVEEDETKPPKQLTEAKLVGDKGLMKKLGLGTEATRSGIIETLKYRKYIENDGKTKLKPTKKGLLLYKITKYVLVGSPGMTAKWKAHLEQIGQGNKSPDPFIKRVKESIKLMFSELNDNEAGTEAVQTIKTQNLEEIGNYQVRTKNKLFEITPEGASEHFPLWRNIAGAYMSKSDMRDLLMKGKTSKKKKMKSKKGNEFKAYWVLKNQRVEFEF